MDLFPRIIWITIYLSLLEVTVLDFLPVYPHTDKPDRIAEVRFADNGRVGRVELDDLSPIFEEAQAG